MFTRGWWFASRMTSHTSTSTSSQTAASSLAKAMLTSRKEFSVSLAISALVASVSRISPSQKRR